MKQTRDLMGMPITVEVVDEAASQEILEDVFRYFQSIDERFSTYKETSEISKINRGMLPTFEWSDDMRTVFRLSEETKRLTQGYFDIAGRDGKFDPSGLVKGWCIQEAALLLDRKGMKHFYLDVGGDIQTRGKNASGRSWSVGIRSPFRSDEIVKVVYPGECGVATSGTYLRGQHIYDPNDRTRILDEIVSLTVIGPNVYEADRFATAAFAMGPSGIEFIERLQGFEGYQIGKEGIATMTSGFARYTKDYA